MAGLSIKKNLKKMERALRGALYFIIIEFRVIEKMAYMKVWDVELGLAVHVKSPNGKFIVVDLGSKEETSPLQALRGCEVGYMVITHPHYDHISDVGNIEYARPEVLRCCREYTREELLDEVDGTKKRLIEQYCDFIESYNVKVGVLNDPMLSFAFDGLTAEVFEAYDLDRSDKNNLSSLVVLKLGNSKIVVCGDNTVASFEEMMVREDFKNAVADADVLVAAHHGRKSGYYEEFVSLVNPGLTIISDTKLGETSVSDMYSRKSSGMGVHDHSTNKYGMRRTLTTRKDGNIMVAFNEKGVVGVSTHI